MYVNQIDNIIDSLLDQLATQMADKNGVLMSIIEGSKLNFVEYRDKINEFIANFMDEIDIAPIQELINNKQNLIRIIEIIKRYVAYYYFLSIAYYYTGTIKDFRNNLIQYSKLQESSTFFIKNFFDTENNYQIIKFFKIIKDCQKILLMTNLQKKSINASDVKDAINFLNGLGKDYIDNYLLEIVNINGEETVQINPHNLIKTIVFGQIYQNQERSIVFEILSDIEENDTEFIYIDVVINRDELSDYENIRQIFLGEENGEILAKDLYELSTELDSIVTVPSVDTNNSYLIQHDMVVPIVDDFLRYHRDSERLELDNNKGAFVPLVNNQSKNVQLALLYQQRKKKENTKAQLIVSKIDAISDLYSNNVKSNPDMDKDIKKHFQNPFAYRKAVLHNYLDEIRVVYKIINQGKRAIEGNEYFLELKEIINNAYFNFRDFKNYGTNILISPDKTINMLRYSNIENLSTMTNLEVDTRTGSGDVTINMVGLAIKPLNGDPVQCVKKRDLVDIRQIKFNYMKNGQKRTIQSENGYAIYLKMIKYSYIKTIEINLDQSQKFYQKMDEIRELNPDLVDKLVYWIYDIEKDEYDVGAYENAKLYIFQERIRVMNSNIYESIIKMFNQRIIELISSNAKFDTEKIESMVEVYSVINRLNYSTEEKRELIIKNYLQTKPIASTQIEEVLDENRTKMPKFITKPEKKPYRINISTINPLHLVKHTKIEAYSKEAQEILEKEKKCQHESEWNKMIRMKSENVNRYNVEVTQFIEKFVVKTPESDFVCKTCGQVLPMKEYVQDGSFDNNTQRFITAYVPVDIPLDEITEYRKYGLIIRYLDALVNRFSLITGTNMLTGTTTANRQRRKAMVKNIIDLMIKHNSINMSKNISMEDRLEYYSKKFNIDKDLDSVYFFEVDNSIIDFSDTVSSNVEISKLKFNNMILYFVLVFISELNGAQISMMTFDKKIGNIFVFLNYGPKLFGDLLIKKNVNDTDTVPITNYPVLCYLIFIISYYLLQYKLWNYSANNTKTFNPVFQKMIINSLVDLFNSIMIDAGKFSDDYIYLLTSSKLYTQLNNVFNNNEIINLLKNSHAKYATKTNSQLPINPLSNIILSYSIEHPIQIGPEPRSLPTYKIGDGKQYPNYASTIFHNMETPTNLTNCPEGSFHKWKLVGKEVVCTICGEKGLENRGDVNRLDDAYYFNLNKLANRRCIQGTLHDYVGKNGEFVCLICGAVRGQSYSRAELDQLSANLETIENEKIQSLLKMIATDKEISANMEEKQAIMIEELMKTYQTSTGEKIYGQMTSLVGNLMEKLESIFGPNNSFNIDTYPVYLDNNIYIIDHSYNGSTLPEPILINQDENLVHFKENHSYFKIDVYYYSDNRSQVDVFYDAVTLKILGYKEKHRDYVRLNTPNTYLKISKSIRERILTMGFGSKYINLEFDSKNPTKNSNNYHNILDNLIKEHVSKTRTIVDKFVSIFNKVIFYQPVESEEESIPLQTTQIIDQLVAKYYPLVKNLNLDQNKTFNEWNVYRNAFNFQPIKWSETNITPTDNKYLNVDIINYYDVSGNIIMFYFIAELISVLDEIKNTTDKMNVSQMYIEIISYLYQLYNTDRYRNALEYKRFGYLLDGSPMMIDIMKKGQGLEVSKAVEDNLADDRPDLLDVEKTEDEQEELEDLREEAEALDIDEDYYAEEDEDYGEQGDMNID